jgi:hypothetical protein
MWPVVRRHTDAFIAALAYGRWAGVPLVCVGNKQQASSTLQHDYPASLLDNDEVNLADLRKDWGYENKVLGHPEHNALSA